MSIDQELAWLEPKSPKEIIEELIDVDNKLVFAKPFLYKNGIQLQEYFITNALKKSPTYTWFGKSGECYCGAHAEEWELKLLEKHDPLAFDTIKWLEGQIDLFGTPKAKRYHKWGSGPSTEDVKNQTTFDDFFDVPLTINEDYCGESCTPG